MGALLLLLRCVAAAAAAANTGGAVSSSSSSSSSSSVATRIVPPNTSLATIPVAYFGGTTKLRPHANVEMLAKMRIVMVEKWEGHCWADCLANATATPPRHCEATCDVERDMLATLRAVKGLNPNVSTVFYWNTLLAFPFYAQVGKFAQADALLIDVNTKVPSELPAVSQCLLFPRPCCRY
jgi:hypothetical protein